MQDARWCAVEKLIETMLRQGDVWFARMEDISAYVRTLIDQGRYVPRVDKLRYNAELLSINR